MKSPGVVMLFVAGLTVFTSGGTLRAILPPGAPSLRQLPSAIVKAVLFGVVTGPPLGLFFTWFNQEPWQYLRRDPAEWLLRAAAIGVTYSLSFYVACGLLVCYVLRRLGNAPPRRAKVILALAGLTGGVLGCLAALVGLAVIVGHPVNPRLLRLTVLDGIFAIGLVFVIDSWHRLRLEKELADARTQAHTLQAQINPHFFFNTLNTISALIPVDPAAAQRTLGLLADMSRHAFASAEAGLVPLVRELEFARAYLEIERVRFGERLRTELPDPAAAEGLSLPALTLQPLVENAVRYGVARRIEGGTVSIAVRRDGARFSLTVENDREPGETLSAAAFFKPGHALMNIRERLRLIYRGQATIDLSSPSKDRVAMTIEVPIRP